MPKVRVGLGRLERMTLSDAAALLDMLGVEATHADAERLLLNAGWTPCGAGDWAFALAAPEGDVVARISPFDPVGPYTARLYREAAATGRVPRLLAHRRLAGGGDLQVMERLHAAPESDAVDFLARLAVDPHFAELAAAVARVHADARRDLPWCGPLDSNPSNVMRTLAGRLVLTDPYYADGPHLYGAAEDDPDRVIALIPESERRFMTEIPLAESGPWAAEDREALREKLRRADEAARSHLLLIGGRSGVGKSTIASALHELLSERDVKHALVEGDALDLAHPAPWEHHLAERNLSAIWSNYRSLGYRRLVYTNTISVLEAASLADAMGDDPRVTSVLLRASDESTAQRLAVREHGASLELHLERSARMAPRLDTQAPVHVHRIDTDGRTPRAIALEVAGLIGWDSS